MKNGDRLEISYEITESSTSDVEIDFIMNNPDGSILHKVITPFPHQLGLLDDLNFRWIVIEKPPLDSMQEPPANMKYAL